MEAVNAAGFISWTKFKINLKFLQNLGQCGGRQFSCKKDETIYKRWDISNVLNYSENKDKVLCLL